MFLIYSLVGFLVLSIVLLPGDARYEKKLDDIQQEKFLIEWNLEALKKEKELI